MINSRSNMKRDKSVACRDAGLMRRDAKAMSAPSRSPSVKTTPMASPVTGIIIKATYMP